MAHSSWQNDSKSEFEVFLAIFLAAARMSRRRISARLGGTNRLLEHLVPDLSSQGGECHEVSLATQDLGEAPANPREVQQTNWLSEFHDKVDVAVLGSLVAHHGAKDQQRRDAQCTEFVTVTGQPDQDAR